MDLRWWRTSYVNDGYRLWLLYESGRPGRFERSGEFEGLNGKHIFRWSFPYKPPTQRVEINIWK